MQSPPIKRALISVSDKFGLAGFAKGLAAAGVEIYSTGGTRKHPRRRGDQGPRRLRVHRLSRDDGRPLKTLHPKVFGGLLCRHDNPSDMQSLAEHDIVTFELVVVNLYPFEATIAREGVTRAEAIEKIDIGGPSLVRAAAKNHAFTTVATDAEQYSAILEQVSANGATTLELRDKLAAEAFAHTAKYDKAIAAYFAGETAEGPFPGTIGTTFKRKAVLRYGENPHQQAALYAEAGATGANLISAMQLNGKELSYNNPARPGQRVGDRPVVRRSGRRRTETQQPLWGRG